MTPGLFQHNHPATSVAAAHTVPNLTGKRIAVLRVIAAKPCTDEWILEATGMSPNTARPRRVELVDAGYVRDSGTVARTRSGVSAIVWEVTDAGIAALNRKGAPS